MIDIDPKKQMPFHVRAGMHVIINAGVDWAEDFSFTLWTLQYYLFDGGESVWREMRVLVFFFFFGTQACVCAEPSSLGALSCCSGSAWPHCETNRQVDLSVTLPLLARHGCTKHPFTLTPMWETISRGKKATLPAPCALCSFNILPYVPLAKLRPCQSFLPQTASFCVTEMLLFW